MTTNSKIPDIPTQNVTKVFEKGQKSKDFDKDTKSGNSEVADLARVMITWFRNRAN